MVVACLVLACLFHPMHTTLTTLSYDPRTASLTATTRAFADDLGRALARAHQADSTYARATIALADQTGRPLPTTWCGSRREGDVLWLCVRTAAPRGPSGMTIAARALFDVFDDQVNIVMAEYDGRRASLLFTKGDPPRRLP